MGLDTSLWDYAPTGDFGPGVANLQGTTAYVQGSDMLSPGFGAGGTLGGRSSSSGGGGDPCAGKSGLDYVGCKIGTWLGTYNNPQQQPERDYGTGYGETPRETAKNATQAAQGVTDSLGKIGDVATILTNRSLWILAGMILLFVILVAVIRR